MAGLRTFEKQKKVARGDISMAYFKLNTFNGIAPLIGPFLKRGRSYM